MLKKIIIYVLIITLIITSISILSSCDDQQTSYTLKFASMPLTGGGKTTLYPYTILWDNSAFKKTPSVFSPMLAKTAMVLSAGAYDNDIALENLEILGFSRNAKFNYHTDYDPQSVGVIISSKQIEDTTIIAVVLRGTSGKEWYSNFDIGRDIEQSGVHKGFSTATSFVNKKIEMYLVNYGVDKSKAKFFVTGHSRGAAVANLLSADLIDKYSSDNVYAYTFATPNTTTLASAKDAQYKGIFNFVNPEDFIPYIPLENWGFTKYGTTITFPSSDTDPEFKIKLEQASKNYTQYTGRRLKTFKGTKKLNEFLQTAYTLAPTVNDYYEKKHEICGLSMSMYEYMMTVAFILNNENILTNGLIIIGSDGTDFEPIKNYILSGMNINTASFSMDYNNSLIGYAHTAQTYMAWLDVYIENL